MIPCRNVVGQIVALKVRQDEETDNKYVYVSSTKHAGPGPGSPPHVPLGTKCPADRVRLTEGELKADVASVLDATPTISAPGVTNWRPCIALIKELGAKSVVLSMDADAARKPQVARAVRACADALTADGIQVELERWNEDDGKGIDDLLAAGKQPELLVGEDAANAIAALAPEPGSDDGDLTARLHDTLNGGGQAALFRDAELLGALAKLAVTNASEHRLQPRAVRPHRCV